MLMEYRRLRRRLNRVSAAMVIDCWIAELLELQLIGDLDLRRIDRMLAQKPLRIAA